MSTAAWAAALDRLEADVELAERLVEDPSFPGVPEPWSPPHLEGRLPAELADRTRDLLARQERALLTVGAALQTVSRHQELVAKVDRATRRTGAPIYLDVTA